MRQLYTLIYFLALPVVLLYLLWRSVKNPEYRKNIPQRLGWLPDVSLDGSVWIHAVSVGEVQASEPLVKRLIETHPDLSVVVTTTTPTGCYRLKELFGSQVMHFYFPFDLPFCINRYINALNPKLLVIFETEIWPNLLHVFKKKNIPSLLLNARMSEKSARGYGRLRCLTEAVFNDLELVGAQSPSDADRFLCLGMDSERIRITGNIKFDIRFSGALRDQGEAVRRMIGGRRVWIAASTHIGEDEVVLEVHERVREKFPDALLILVPRHPERFDRVYKLVTASGFRVCKRSENYEIDTQHAVYLGDTMGELPVLFSAADVAFVGGSLVPAGGHNILEPATLGVPVAFGPYMFNFNSISKMFLAENAAVQVASGDELANVLIEWLGDASKRSEVGEVGKRLFDENSGALERLCDLIEPYLPK